MAAKDKIFWRYPPCHLVKNHRGIRDHLCPHPRGLVIGAEAVYEMSVMFNWMTQKTAQEDFISNKNNTVFIFFYRHCFYFLLALSLQILKDIFPTPTPYSLILIHTDRNVLYTQILHETGNSAHLKRDKAINKNIIRNAKINKSVAYTLLVIMRDLLNASPTRIIHKFQTLYPCRLWRPFSQDS
jgi:hypothetical protein